MVSKFSRGDSPQFSYHPRYTIYLDLPTQGKAERESKPLN